MQPVQPAAAAAVGAAAPRPVTPDNKTKPSIRPVKDEHAAKKVSVAAWGFNNPQALRNPAAQRGLF